MPWNLKFFVCKGIWKCQRAIPERSWDFISTVQFWVYSNCSSFRWIYRTSAVTEKYLETFMKIFFVSKFMLTIFSEIIEVVSLVVWIVKTTALLNYNTSVLRASSCHKKPKWRPFEAIKNSLTTDYPQQPFQY